MGRVFFIVILGIMLSSSGAQADWVNGQTLYLNGPPGIGLACQDCHGSPPSLFNIGQAANNPTLIASKIQTNPPMSPFQGRLTSADLDDIAAYIASPNVNPKPLTVPGAPTGVAAVAGNGSATLSFAAPVNTGGSTIASYTATCTGGATPVTGVATTAPILLTGMTNGTTYSCTVKASNSSGSSIASAAATVVTVNPAAVAPYMGLWWNPGESGWGMSITQHGNTIFAVPYTYDSAGQPTWYAMSNCPMLTAGSCTGDLYKVSGGSSPVVAWNGLGKVVSSAGSGTLSFDDVNHGRFTYILNGVSGSKSIERQLFSNGTPQFSVDYTDLWWNPNESGWGVALTQDHGMIFAAWYAYKDKGEAIWYVASSCPLSGNLTSGHGCTGDLYQVVGGSPLTANWNGANKAVTAVGSVTFTFSDADNGTMAYLLNGVAGTRIITRQGF